MPPDTDPAVEDPATASQAAPADGPTSAETPVEAAPATEAAPNGQATKPAAVEEAEAEDKAGPEDETGTTDEAGATSEAGDAEKAEEGGPDGDGSTPPAEPDSPGSRPGRRLLAAAAVAVVVLGGLGGWATWKAHGLRAAAAQRNVALTDRTQTSAVAHQVASAVNTIFSYSYADTARTRQAAQSLLTGPAIRQYDRLFTLVQSQAPKQKLVVTTRVTSTGVEFLAAGRARLLVFANQQDTKAGTTQSSYAGAMFAVTAINQNGHWKIESIDTFTGS